MQTNEMPFTLADLKKFDKSAETRKLRGELIAARAKSEILSEKVAELTKVEFANWEFYRAKPTSSRRDSGEVGTKIEDPKLLYRSNDEEKVAAYYARMDQIVAPLFAEYYPGERIEPGYCPALVAQERVRLCERALLAHASAILGFDFTGYVRGDLRNEIIDAFMNGPAAKRSARQKV